MTPGTWVPVASPVADAFELLAERPALSEGYRSLRATVVRESALSPDLARRCEERVAWLLAAAADEPAATTDLEQAVFAYADAFVRDPHAVTDAHVAALRTFLSVGQIVGLTELLALLDGFTRFRLVLAAGDA